ncbi:NnrS family protein [Mesorhizobium sp. VK25A]|uniref:NnrS family protein n=1 Tax=Mesorhizobium vachelliae TaxID=3072309 RepID=A0ABU5A2Y6_9HYPH|nr:MULTISPECIES: NnrS family protein [unclassified Mesorhizobium]MDX8531610.1 NnrS family protein [Mesorhizobium sp. VK25D]MDX8543947.1 NnrS family protein [Mesorhizobium sp. VK25A]
MRRGPLIFHAAGVFFALASIVAAVLPWLWLLPLVDPWQAHVRLGIFGFGGMAVSGYLLTAQRAWTRQEAPLPTLGLAALALGARLLALAEPQSTWLVCLPSLVVALATLLPVLQARRWDKVPLALVPLGLVIAEGALIWQQIPAAALPLAMGALILAVGGRMIPAFLIEERRRRGLPQRHAASMWPGLVMMGVGAASSGAIGTSALAVAALWVLHRAWGGLGAWPANQMLCLGYAALAAGLLGIVAARLGMLPPLAQVHLLAMGTMGSMVAAVAARVSMRRIEGIGLVPLTRHWIALWLILAATGARCLAEMTTPHHALMTMAGIAWSAAWLLFLSAHVAALRHPAPFPLLSAERVRSRLA